MLHVLDLVFLVLGRVGLVVAPLLELGVLAREHLAVVVLALRLAVAVALHRCLVILVKARADSLVVAYSKLSGNQPEGDYEGFWNDIHEQN